jgi:hypothetical protein
MSEPCHYCGAETIPSTLLWEMIDALPQPHHGPVFLAEQTRLYRHERVVDHKTPRSRGGANTPNNRVIACRHCNGRKGARPYLDFLFETWHAEAMREREPA